FTVSPDSVPVTRKVINNPIFEPPRLMTTSVKLPRKVACHPQQDRNCSSIIPPPMENDSVNTLIDLIDYSKKLKIQMDEDSNCSSCSSNQFHCATLRPAPLGSPKIYIDS
ncbi:hypothetical protein Ciccas_014629, partial [Cichlidogyrus casuarinus]